MFTTLSNERIEALEGFRLSDFTVVCFTQNNAKQFMRSLRKDVIGTSAIAWCKIKIFSCWSLLDTIYCTTNHCTCKFHCTFLVLFDYRYCALHCIVLFKHSGKPHRPVGGPCHIILKWAIPVALFKAPLVPAGVRTHNFPFQRPWTYHKATGESVYRSLFTFSYVIKYYIIAH